MPIITSISISGPTEIVEDNSAGYNYLCKAHYSNGRTKDVTGQASWSENSDYASFTDPGTLATLNVPADTDTNFEITASYKRKNASLEVTIMDQSSPDPQPPEGRMVIDPITRIEGHLRIETQISGGKVTEA